MQELLLNLGMSAVLIFGLLCIVAICIQGLGINEPKWVKMAGGLLVLLSGLTALVCLPIWTLWRIWG